MILAGQFASETEVQRFYAEARAAANLQHRNIVAIHEVGQHEGQHYFSMDYIEGKSLAQIVRENPLPADKASAYLKTIAEAIEFAHRQGTLHRDLKPSNVLIDSFDEPRITDFGLAKRIEGTAQITVTGPITGTPSYMPPEQAGAYDGKVSPASDVYSLGALLYDLLTGRPPFLGENLVVTLNQVLNSEPVAPRLLSPEVPRDLETICLKCLQKDPQKRYPSAAALADDLGRFLRHEPITARPVSQWERGWRWCKRNPVIASLSATVVLLILVSAIGGPALTLLATRNARDANENAKLASEERRRADAARIDAERSAAEAILQRREAESQRDNAEWQLYGTHIAEAQRDWDANNIEGAWHHLDSCRRDFRGWEYRYLYARFTKNQKTLTRSGGPVLTGLRFSSNGKWVAAIGSLSIVKIWEASSGREVKTLEGLTLGEQSAVEFSPDGKRIATQGSDGSVYIWDPIIPRQLVAISAKLIVNLAFSPDGKRIAGGFADGRVEFWNASNGQQVFTAKSKEPGVTIVKFSPVGKCAAFTLLDGSIKSWDPLTGREVVTFKVSASQVRSWALSPDAQWLAVGTTDNMIQAWDASSGRLVRTFKAERLTDIDISPNGKRIVYGSEDGTVRICDLPSGQEIGELRGHSHRVSSVAFSPDGRQVASASESWNGTVLISDVSRSQDGLVLQGMGPSAFSPDGNFIAAAGGDNVVKVWAAKNGEESLSLKCRENFAAPLAFAPDGERVALGGRRGYVQFVDPATDLPANPIGAEGAGTVTGVAYSADGHLIATASDDHICRIFDTSIDESTRAEPITFKGHADCVSAVAFSPDGTRIATGSVDRTIKVWAVSNGKELFTFQGHSASVSSVAYSPDGKRIVSGSLDGTAKVFDAFSGHEFLTFREHRTPVNGVAFSGDGKRVASGSSDGSLKVWDASTGVEALTVKAHTRELTSVAFSRDNKWIASGSEDGTIKIWDASNGAKVRTIKADLGGVGSLAFSPDGTRLAGGARDGLDVTIWNSSSGQPIRAFRRGARPPTGVTFSPNGSWIAAAVEGAIKIWDASSGRTAFSLAGDTDFISFAFSPDARRIAGAEGKETIKIWETPSGQAALNLSAKVFTTGAAGVRRSISGSVEYPTCVAYSPSGKWLATGSSNPARVTIWDAPKSQKSLTFEMPADVTSVAFSPNRRVVVAGLEDGTLRMLDASSGQEIRVLKGHLQAVLSVAVSPDGTRIASGSRDTTIKIWDSVDGHETLSLRMHDWVNGVAFSPDGNRLAAHSGSIIQVWDAPARAEAPNVGNPP